MPCNLSNTVSLYVKRKHLQITHQISKESSFIERSMMKATISSMFKGISLIESEGVNRLLISLREMVINRLLESIGDMFRDVSTKHNVFWWLQNWPTSIIVQSRDRMFVLSSCSVHRTELGLDRSVHITVCIHSSDACPYYLFQILEMQSVLVDHFSPVLSSPEVIQDQWTMLKAKLYLEPQQLKTLTWVNINPTSQNNLPWHSRAYGSSSGYPGIPAVWEGT